MATFSVNIVYPDADQTRIINALKYNYGQIKDVSGAYRDRTNAELLDAFRKTVRDNLAQIVLTFEHQTAIAAVQTVSVT